jgi:glyoxylase-like metal-dependent hydrolase (beta-lactamase superfamily II)
MTLLLAETGYEVHAVVVGPMDNNVFVIRCTETGDGVLIDAANEHERLLELCRSLGVRRVIETHGHWDHIQAVPAAMPVTTSLLLLPMPKCSRPTTVFWKTTT